MKITLFGAAEQVTGSKCLVELGRELVLIDCGMVQGEDAEKSLVNSEIDGWANQIDKIFITHGHYDHCGYLPRIFKKGFLGKVYASPLTIQIAKIVLADAYKIHLEKFNQGKIKELLYEEQDLDRCFSAFEAIEEETDFDSYKVKPIRAGHILGATSYLFRFEDKNYLFSGDLGQKRDFIHYAPELTQESLEFLLLESTYGDRDHNPDQLEKQFSNAIRKIKKSEGVLLLASFAVARTQILIYFLRTLMKENPDLDIPIFVDSPMAVEVTKLYLENKSTLKPEGKKFKSAVDKVKLVEFGNDVTKLKKAKGPYILIASSGMMDGGRIVKAIEHFAKDEKNILGITGFQAPGTRGKLILQGEKEISILGHKMTIRSEVIDFQGLSAHADQSELLEYVANYIKNGLKRLILNHGNPEAIDSFFNIAKAKFPDLEILIAHKGMVIE